MTFRHSVVGSTVLAGVSFVVLMWAMPARAQDYSNVPEKPSAANEQREAQERAVGRALKWVAARQQSDGGWELEDSFEMPNVESVSSTQATGLAMLAFAGAGQTQNKGIYREPIKRAIAFLRSQQVITDGRADLRGKDQSMRSHAIAAVALCELCAMSRSRDPALKQSAQMALNQTIAWQDAQKGGWSEQPGGPPDLRATVWQIMALHSGTLALLQAPNGVRKAALSFVKSSTGTASPFRGAAPPDTSPQEIAMACVSQYHAIEGQERELIRPLIAFLESQPASALGAEGEYFATESIFHFCHSSRDAQWQDWERPLAARLVETQIADGPEAGSWFPEEEGDSNCGQFATTAFNALSLEVYYRMRPLVDFSKRIRVDLLKGEVGK